jgi:hypothetical protein
VSRCGAILAVLLYLFYLFGIGAGLADSNKAPPLEAFVTLSNSHEKRSQQLLVHHWTPIDAYFSDNEVRAEKGEVVIELCRLDWDKYSAAPHKYANFKLFVKASNCAGSHVLKYKLSDLKREYENVTDSNDAGPALAPTGFIFHESRVILTTVYF